MPTGVAASSVELRRPLASHGAFHAYLGLLSSRLANEEFREVIRKKLVGVSSALYARTNFQLPKPQKFRITPSDFSLESGSVRLPSEPGGKSRERPCCCTTGNALRICKMSRAVKPKLNHAFQDTFQFSKTVNFGL